MNNQKYANEKQKDFNLNADFDILPRKKKNNNGMSGRVNIKTIIKGLLRLSRMKDISVCIKLHMREGLQMCRSVFSLSIVPVPK